MNILLVNDDGIDAAGISHLAAAAAPFGDLWIVAPDGQCSAMSHRVTIRTPMTFSAADFPLPAAGAWKLGGMPADCVKVALNYALPMIPDLILSGINHGLNVGYDTYYSGTVSAAIEGAIHEIPSIAVSNQDGSCWDTVDQFLPDILRELIRTPAPKGHIWNVNFPACPLSECRGIIRDTAVYCGFAFAEDITPIPSPSGELSLSQDGESRFFLPAPEGTDMWAIQNNSISIGTIRWQRSKE